MMSGHLDRHDDSVQPAAGQKVDEPHKQPADQTSLTAGSARNARHGNLLADTSQLDSPTQASVQLGSERLISSCSFCKSSARCSVLNSRCNSSKARATMWYWCAPAYLGSVVMLNQSLCISS